MKGVDVVILSDGGIRSLVATAAELSSANPPKIAIVHVRGVKPGSVYRREYVRQQAEHFGATKVVELELERLKEGQGADSEKQGAALGRLHMLVLATATAVEWGAGRVIWPVHSNGDFRLASRVTEQLVLLQHLVDLERPQAPAVETPLLELTDRQLIELGAQLEVPWQLGWTCLSSGDRPCKVCDGCKWRKRAFESAGMLDPVASGSPHERAAS